MFWEKKKGQGLPDLPKAPMGFTDSMPREYQSGMMDDDSERERIHELPSFPDSPMQKGFSQSAIKEAITTEEIPQSRQMAEFPEEEETAFPKDGSPAKDKYKIVEMEEWSPNAKSQAMPITSSVGSIIPPAPTKSTKASAMDNKPVFIKLDKFQLARNTLDGVRVKLTEVEELLKRIRDVKSKEDQELSSWESEMESIKTRIQTVMNDIFDRAEY